MSKKLFPSLEEYDSRVTSDRIEADSDTIETVIAENNVRSVEVERETEAATRIVNALDALENYTEILSVRKNSGGIDASSANLIQIGVESIATSVGISTADIRFSLEAIDEDSSVHNAVVALEGIQDVIKKITKNASLVLDKLKTTLLQRAKAFVQIFTAYGKEAKKLKAEIKDAPFDKTEVDAKKLTNIVVNGKVDVSKAVVNAKDFVTNFMGNAVWLDPVIKRFKEVDNIAHYLDTLVIHSEKDIEKIVALEARLKELENEPLSGTKGFKAGSDNVYRITDNVGVKFWLDTGLTIREPFKFNRVKEDNVKNVNTAPALNKNQATKVLDDIIHTTDYLSSFDWDDVNKKITLDDLLRVQNNSIVDRESEVFRNFFRFAFLFGKLNAILSFMQSVISKQGIGAIIGKSVGTYFGSILATLGNPLIALIVIGSGMVVQNIEQMLSNQGVISTASRMAVLLEEWKSITANSLYKATEVATNDVIGDALKYVKLSAGV
jgi:hypothetical protein